MASKADRLKGGANRASTGLFAGMTPLSRNGDSSESKSASAKKVEKPTEKPVKSETSKKAEPEKPVESKIEVEKVTQPVVTVEKTNTETPKVSVVQEETVINRSEVPVVAEMLGEKVAQIDNIVAEPEPKMNVPVQQYVPDPQVQQYTQQVPVQNIQTPQYQTYQPVQPQPVQAAQYQVPNTYQQPVMQQPVMPAYNEPKTTGRQPKQDKSRYEKEKFLLLDIRGYRDYVEHMAKASNMSATKYIRSLIEQDMLRNMDIYQQHKQLEEALKARR